MNVGISARFPVHVVPRSRVTEIAGSVGAKLHTGRSRNDQEGAVERLYLRDLLLEVIGDLLALTRELTGLARDHVDTVMPGEQGADAAQTVEGGEARERLRDGAEGGPAGIDAGNPLATQGRGRQAGHEHGGLGAGLGRGVLGRPDEAKGGWEVMATNLQVRTMVRAEPFRPFLVKLADGRSFEVRHPENIACATNGREMTIYDDDGMHLIEMLLVVEMAPRSGPATAKRKAGGK